MNISYTKTGSGPVIVWIHGFMETKKIWKKQTAFFEKTHTNICIDLLGHGETENLGEIHSMETQAEAVISVLNRLSVNEFSIVGHSMGGYVALAVLEQLKEKITHFVLLNSTSHPDSEEKKINRERAIKIVAEQKNSFARMGVTNLFSESSKKQFKAEIEEIIKSAQELSVQGITVALQGMKNRISRLNTLKNYQGKKVIVSGKEDPVLLHNTSIEEAKYTNSKLITLKGGHMSYLEEAEVLNIELISFLKKTID